MCGLPHLSVYSCQEDETDSNWKFYPGLNLFVIYCCLTYYIKCAYNWAVSFKEKCLIMLNGMWSKVFVIVISWMITGREICTKPKWSSKYHRKSWHFPFFLEVIRDFLKSMQIWIKCHYGIKYMSLMIIQ